MGKGFTRLPSGFWINFDNGYSISVQFGYGNYCNNYTEISLLESTKENYVLRCDNAEVAIKYDNDLVTQSIWSDIFSEDIGDSVASHVTPLQVVKILSYISSLPPQTN